MKRLFLTLLCFLFAYPCFAGEPIQLARMNPWVAGSANATTASCNPLSNEIGERGAITADAPQSGKNYIQCRKRSADCSGELDTGYLYSRGDNSSSARVCVYTWHSDSVLDSSDTKVSCTSSLLTDETASYSSSAMDAGGDVTSSTNYWLCEIIQYNGWNPSKVGTGTVKTFYAACNGTNCSAVDPPSDLGDVDGSWTDGIGSIDYNKASYVTIK